MNSTHLHSVFNRYNAIPILHPSANFRYSLRTSYSIQYYKFLAGMKIMVQIGIY